MTGDRQGWPSLGALVALAAAAGGCQLLLDWDSVLPPAPPAFTYSEDPASYLVGRPIQDNVPSTGAVPVSSYEIHPLPPAGLQFDTATGILSGTPSVLSPPAVYVVTATNASGTGNATLSIGVHAGAGPVQRLTAGESHTCAVVNGGLLCWGENGYGQLGDGRREASHVPVQALGLVQDVQSIAAHDHTCAVAGGAVKCWGYNHYGQLGNDTIPQDKEEPVDVQGLAAGVRNVATGSKHTCALLVDGGVQCWGWNEHGQLGNGATQEEAAPKPVLGLSAGAEAVAAGSKHTCALVDGGVECWGGNSSGQLGNGTLGWDLVLMAAPVVRLPAGVEAIAAREGHTCALADGGVLCWGQNGYGQLGNELTLDSAVPVQVTGLTSGVEAIAAGRYHTCALVGGGVLCWGKNSDGQLGDGTQASSARPVQVVGLAPGVELIAAGEYHTCATADGGVQCWGDNGAGQLGKDPTDAGTSLEPVQVPLWRP